MRLMLRVVLVTTLQIAAVVIAFAFVMTLLFEPGEWSKRDWFLDLIPLLLLIVCANAVVQITRVRRRIKKDAL